MAKVKAHVTLAEVAAGYPTLWKEGNSYADAAAKLGRTLHPIDSEQVREAERALLLTTVVVKFLARVNVLAMKAADDTPAFDRSKINERSVAKQREQGPPRHSVVDVGDRFRCTWGHKSSASRNDIANGHCIHAGGHHLWIAGELIICTLCGGFSSKSTRLLKHTCRRRWSAYGDNNVKRVFDRNLHPLRDTHVDPPVLWLVCKPFQEMCEQSSTALPHEIANVDRGLFTVSLLNTLAREVDLEDTAVRTAFGSSAADSEHYATAIAGHLASSPGVAACTSGDPDFWLPWTGFRQARTIVRGAPIARGTLTRNRFRFPGERLENPHLLGHISSEALPNPEPCSEDEFSCEDPFSHGFNPLAE